MRLRLNPIYKEERGSATIELAIVAPIMAIMIVGVIDLSGAYSRKLHIEQGAQRAIEKVMQTTTTETVHKTLAAEAASAADVPEDQVSVEYIMDCDGTEKNITAEVNAIQAQIDAGTPSENIDKSTTDCPSGTTEERRYLTVTITDLYEPVIDPSVVGIKSQDGKFPINVETGIRTQ